MSKPLPPKYQTINWQSYNQSLKQRGQLLLWLDKDMNWLAPATGRRGRQPSRQIEVTELVQNLHEFNKNKLIAMCKKCTLVCCMDLRT